MSGAPPLTGQKVLIVEDRYLIATEVAAQVDELGGQVAGPARDVATAAAILAREPVDLALLDVNLDGETVFPLAEALADKGVPFIFLTGYDEDILPEAWRDRPRLAKPVGARALSEAIGLLRR